MIAIKRALCAFLIGAFLICSGANEIIAREAIEDTDKNATEQGEQIFAENNVLALAYDEVKQSISILDKRSGVVTSNAVPEELITSADTSELQRDIMRSLFTVRFTSKSDNYVQAIKATTLYTEREMSAVTVKKVKNGFTLSVLLKKYGIGFQAEFILDHDTLTVTIPQNSVTETKNSAVISIEVMPFFMSATPQQDGYLVYPDGSGAIHYFKDGLSLPQVSRKLYSFTVYGNDTASAPADDKEWLSVNELEQQSMLPIMGISRQDGGIFCYATQGATELQVNALSAGTMVNLARIYPSFTIRRIYNPMKSQVGAGSGAGGSQAEVYTIDKQPLNGNKQLKYVFLQKQNCDYNAMAGIYRDYLKAANKLNRSELVNQHVPLMLDVFMGTTQNGFPFDKFISTANYNQVEQIIKTLKNSDVSNLNIQLSGWSKGGYGKYPQQYQPERKLGGKQGLNQLIIAAKEYQTRIFLNTDVVNLRTGMLSPNFSNNRMVAGSGMVITNDLRNRYFYSPFYVKNKYLNKVLTQYINLDVGVALSEIGRFATGDYNKKYPATREQTVEIWRDLISKTGESGLLTAVYGGNEYVLESSDLLLDIPIKDSGLLFTSKSIPFFQLVAHGYIPYTGAPMNLVGDTKTILKHIAYGYIPYYQITYDSPNKLIKTKYNYLYSGKFSEYNQEICNFYAEVNQKLASVYQQEIKSIDQIEDDVYKIVYQNSSVLYVNGTDKEFKQGDVLIPKESYLLTEESGYEE